MPVLELSPLQVWLIAGIPALVAALVAFVGRTPWKSWLGYLALLAGLAALAPVQPAGAVVFAGLIALAIADGRGTPRERRRPDPSARPTDRVAVPREVR